MLYDRRPVRTFVQRRSPWIEQLGPDGPPEPLQENAQTDVAVVGAGIAGVSTAFFLLRETDLDVMLIERDRVGRGATGHNAGQLTTYFERPLGDLVDSYGFGPAIAAQKAIDDTWTLLDLMVAETGATLAIEVFFGHMGMFTLDHLTVHLRSSALRRDGGLIVPECVVADDAPCLAQIPHEFDGLYSVVSPEKIRDMLGTSLGRYCAVLRDRKGCANGALLCQQVVQHLRSTYPERFRFVDHTPVDHIVLEDSTAVIRCREHEVVASRVVMCTNGFVDHVIENAVGSEIKAEMHHRVNGTVGYMVGFIEPHVTEARALSFIRNEVIGGDTPYVYVTSRPYDGGTLVCVGGPEDQVDDVAKYSSDWRFPEQLTDEIDNEILPIVHPDRSPGLDYEFMWHGLMGYTKSRVRLIGFEPANPVLMYNLGCNGVGFLPSIFGGFRVANLLSAADTEPMIFDPQD